jgi:hypothetical protein
MSFFNLSHSAKKRNHCFYFDYEIEHIFICLSAKCFELPIHILCTFLIFDGTVVSTLGLIFASHSTALFVCVLGLFQIGPHFFAWAGLELQSSCLLPSE